MYDKRTKKNSGEEWDTNGVKCISYLSSKHSYLFWLIYISVCFALPYIYIRGLAKKQLIVAESLCLPMWNSAFYVVIVSASVATLADVQCMISNCQVTSIKLSKTHTYIHAVFVMSAACDVIIFMSVFIRKYNISRKNKYTKIILVDFA